jgi:hypothetical protein
MAAAIGVVLDSLEAITDMQSDTVPGDPALTVWVDRSRARIIAERELLVLHGNEHVCADPVMPWLATPYELAGAAGVAGGDGQPCWTLRWLARAHQVIGFPRVLPAAARALEEAQAPSVGEAAAGG